MDPCFRGVCSSLPIYLEDLAGFQQALTKCWSHIRSDKFCEDKQFCWGETTTLQWGKSLLT